MKKLLIALLGLTVLFTMTSCVSKEEHDLNDQIEDLARKHAYCEAMDLANEHKINMSLAFHSRAIAGCYMDTQSQIEHCLDWGSMSYTIDPNNTERLLSLINTHFHGDAKGQIKDRLWRLAQQGDDTLAQRFCLATHFDDTLKSELLPTKNQEYIENLAKQIWTNASQDPRVDKDALYQLVQVHVGGQVREQIDFDEFQRLLGTYQFNQTTHRIASRYSGINSRFQSQLDLTLEWLAQNNLPKVYEAYSAGLKFSNSKNFAGLLCSYQSSYIEPEFETALWLREFWLENESCWALDRQAENFGIYWLSQVHNLKYEQISRILDNLKACGVNLKNFRKILVNYDTPRFMLRQFDSYLKADLAKKPNN